MNTIAILAAALLALSATTFALPLRESSEDMIEDRATGNVQFYLYTKANPTVPQQLFIGDIESVKNSNYEKSRHTKVIIHGWGGAYTTSPNGAVREAYLLHDDYNIISVDWYPYSKLNYISSRAKVPVVGEDCAEFLDFLHENFGLNYKMLVVIGHSLGAHVAGFTGKLVKRGTVAGIVGLDPAYPLYSYENADTRLSSTDADYVQTIQTNGKELGFLKPIGMAAFFPNWGRSQPGCGLDIGGGCAHGRSVTYYAEAVRGYTFEPIKECYDFDAITDKSGCNDLTEGVQIGDPLEVRRVDGIFYFETNDKAPFGELRNKMENL